MNMTDDRRTVIGFIMDPIEAINVDKDSTFAMILAAQVRGWEVRYMLQTDIYTSQGIAYATSRTLELMPGQDPWFSLGEPDEHPLSDCDAVLMRKDPPFDIEYIYTTYALDLVERDGSLIVNKPQSLRDANEKFFTTWFPQCAPETLVTRDPLRLRQFIADNEDSILKPLEGMGGASVFRVRSDDPNIGVIIETLAEHGNKSVMAQRFIPEITDGDKRILVVDGEPVPYALARIPKPGETRGNLAAGGTGQGVALSDRDRWICEQVGPVLKDKGILFAGLDVIGDYLTEVNVTSPTCIRELDKEYGLDIGGSLMDAIARQLN
jgi:glutathione synthase